MIIFLVVVFDVEKNLRLNVKILLIKYVLGFKHFRFYYSVPLNQNANDAYKSKFEAHINPHLSTGFQL